MKIGILGSNDRAIAIGRLLASGGHDVTISDPGDDAKAADAATRAGVTTETPYRQAMTREVLILAAMPERIDRGLASMGSGAAAIPVDATEPRRGEAHDAQALALKLNDHRVVRALVVLPQPGANVTICGDDPEAKATVGRMFESSGCVTTDRGPLAAAVELEPQASAA
ncbi:MAG TPA: NAD(P)-binding domain-containing protein [Candidatus Acidoferrales bacterium]|nr:NAD(P)-binding domain-containing protein [Candidatus Acidoferrales bacterium]